MLRFVQCNFAKRVLLRGCMDCSVWGLGLGDVCLMYLRPM